MTTAACLAWDRRDVDRVVHVDIWATPPADTAFGIGTWAAVALGIAHRVAGRLIEYTDGRWSVHVIRTRLGGSIAIDTDEKALLGQALTLLFSGAPTMLGADLARDVKEMILC